MQSRWLGPGLFFLTFATLLLETLDARLLSVLTWYHLSFLAVSLAMLGMAAGAVYVFLHPDRYTSDRAPASLARTTLLFALAVPASHLMTLAIPFLPLNDVSTMEIVSIAVSTAVLAVPFALSGVAVTVALTRCRGSIGQLYAFDLIGAALGCLAVVPVLEWSNVSSAVFLAAAAAAVSAVCFYRFAGLPSPWRPAVLAAVLVGVAIANTGSGEALQVIYPKNRQLWLLNRLNDVTRWNSHSYVLVQRPGDEQAFLWGAGRGGEQFRTRIAWLAIDGEAGTPITEWDGRRESLEWVSYDVTTLPYYLRRGNVAVIGVGGGRDILAAIWGRNETIVGVDVNRIMVDLLTGSHRTFAKIADQPNVTLVHDDGRAHLTRTDLRFDVIQMSLVDTWASTGAGAFTLSENGLYTLEAWLMFLDRLKPGGILSVSRWFDPQNVSETSRLLALGVAALIERGVTNPLDHIQLVVRGRVATLMVSTAPFSSADKATVAQVAADKDFTIAVEAGVGAPRRGLIDRIAASTNTEELARATAHRLYDYSPPTDARPYYFNMLKLRALWDDGELPRGGALGGNLRATLMLAVLFGITTVLVIALIAWPLMRAGRPAMPTGQFTLTMAYFAVIGFAYMLVQIGFLQRFSVYLGHPTYTLSIVLFSMLLFTGLGSLVSERLAVGPTGRFRLVPVAIAGTLAIVATTLPEVIDRTITSGLATRTAVVLGFAAPLAMLLGFCFPIGVRLVSKTEAVVPWAWGINGAFGVLASILAVGLSIGVGIDANFWLAASLYLLLSLPMGIMARHSGSSD